MRRDKRGGFSKHQPRRHKMLRHVARGMTHMAALAGMLGLSRGAASRAGRGQEPDARCREETRPAHLRRRYRHSGLRLPGCSRQMAGARRRLCRAIAAAMLGDPDKVKYIGTTSKVRFSVLQSGEIDVLIRDSELTLTRNTALGLVEVSDQLLHRPDLHGAQEPQRRPCQGAERGDDLPAHRHDARDATSPTTIAPTTSRSTPCSSRSPRKPSPPPRPGAATATPMTAAASPRRVRR